MEGVSQKDFEHFFFPEKIRDRALLVFLKVSGIKELCVRGVSRCSVEIFLSDSTENFRKRDLLVLVSTCLRFGNCTCMLQNNMPRKSIREISIKFVVSLKSTVRGKKQPTEVSFLILMKRPIKIGGKYYFWQP